MYMYTYLRTYQYPLHTYGKSGYFKIEGTYLFLHNTLFKQYLKLCAVYSIILLHIGHVNSEGRVRDLGNMCNNIPASWLMVITAPNVFNKQINIF